VQAGTDAMRIFITGDCGLWTAVQLRRLPAYAMFRSNPALTLNLILNLTLSLHFCRW